MLQILSLRDGGKTTGPHMGLSEGKPLVELSHYDLEGDLLWPLALFMASHIPAWRILMFENEWAVLEKLRER